MKKVSITLPQQGWGTIKTKYPNDSLFVRLDELTGASKNFDSTVNGNLTKRLGGIDYNAIAFSSPAKDQFEAIFTDGVHHELIVEGGNLQFSSGGGTFTLVTAGYSSLGNFEFALFSDRVYFDNGIDSPQVYDRTTTYGGVVYTVPKTKVMGAQSPATPVTFAADTAGGLVPAGAHTYKVTYLYYDFEESNGGPASAVHTVVNPNNTVHLTAVPIGGYGVTARKIYRDDNDGVYRLVGTVADNTTTIFTDAASTGTALIPLTNSVPPSFKYITTNLDRTWIAGIPGDPSSLRFSEAGLPDIFPSTNDILCNPEDPITAIVVYNKQVWVLNRNSIGKILGNTRDTFQYSPLPGAVGCVDNRSIRIRTIEGVPTLVWLSDKGVWGTNGSSVEYLSDAIEDLVNLNIQQAAQVKGQNAQTSQTQFQAGVASPGIDLTTFPGTITTPNPKRQWDDETDWEGGSSLTNIATNQLNQISVPTAHPPTFASGTHAGTVEISGTLRTPIAADFLGEHHENDSGNEFIQLTGATFFAQPVIANRSGTITAIHVNVPGVGGGASGVFRLSVWAANPTAPGSLLFQSAPIANPPAANGVFSATVSIPVTGGQVMWIGLQQSAFAPSPTVNTTISTTSYLFNNGNRPFLWSNNGGTVWNTSGGGRLSMICGYTYSQSPVATSGTWTGPSHDSFADSAVAGTIAHAATFPAGTSSTTTVQASDDSDFASGIISQDFSSLNGSTAVSLSGKRYWRIRIQLFATDDRTTAQISPATLTYATTGTWISEVIDHTTDITTLNVLSFVTNVPVGTTATLEIATSANNITYSSFTDLSMAVAQRYSKVRIILTTTSNNVTTPTVTSALLTWVLVSNLVSSAIDTGNTPAGWDIFQAQFATNGGSVVFFIRSATTAFGLTAETFVSVTNGTFPTIPVNRFVQWKVVITSTGDIVPTVDSITVNWFISQTSSIRVASLFFNRSYYLAAAEFNQTSNNVVMVLDGEDKWRVYRDINVNTLGLFFNDPYYGSATEGRLIRFLSGNTDQGVAIPMVVESKAIDFGDLEHAKIGRKLYVTGVNTGAVYQVFMSFDQGETYYPMLDVTTGLTTFTTPNDGRMFYRRFQLDFTLGNLTAGKTINFKITESTAASAQIDSVKLEGWIRSGELVS